MAKTLVIVESPAKAKTIRKFLGSNYQVKSSMGHVRDLPRSQFGVDTERDFEPKYITIRGKGDVVKELKAAAKKSDRVLLATDPDREGEAIAWHLLQLLDLNDESNCRIQFNEITKNAIKNAVKDPHKVDFDRVDAQQARRILDRLVGYNLSPLLWRKVKKGLSAGRVQSVAVRLIVDREQAITEFNPEEYWTLTAMLKVQPTDCPTAVQEQMIEAELTRIKGEKAVIPNERVMGEIIKGLKDKEFVVQEVLKRAKQRKPTPPFTTSSMQQEAYRRLNFTARKTMMLAQQLYEGIDLGKGTGTVGMITYLRTDSTRVSPEAQEEARHWIEGKYGKEYLPQQPPTYASNKRAQDAHETIRPTAVDRLPEEVKDALSRDQYRLYRLIWERFVASQMAPAVMDTTSLKIVAGDCQFNASGFVIRFHGFMKLYVESDEDKEKRKEGILPELSQGESLALEKLSPEQHFTQPPPRFSEATLVKTLEEMGIGRPSTYAPIIETILARGYVVREQKQFYPTELGIIVVDLLRQYFNDIVDVEFTANLEEKLDQIEDGKVAWKEVLREFYEPFSQILSKAEEQIGQIEIEEEKTEEVCELCGRNMVVKMGRFGKFLACPGFPECRNTKPYLEEIGVKCPDCSGEVVLRRSKKGRPFYGCRNYPDCDFVSWEKPTESKCPECGTFLVEKNSKRQGTRLVCSNKECNYQKLPEQTPGG